MTLRSISTRWAVLFLTWIALAGAGAADLVVGAAAAALAGWISLQLLPPAATRLRPGAVVAFGLRLASQSFAAGLDVARRAFDPALPLRPGFADYPTQLAAGSRRAAFRALMSLQPGSLPVEIGKAGALRIHCLDTSMPVASDYAREENVFSHMLGHSGDD